MGFCRRAGGMAAALFVFLTALFCAGCSAAGLRCVLVSARLSEDGSGVLAVHRCGDRLVLTVRKDGGPPVQRAVAGPSAAWLDGRVACEIVTNGRRRVAVFDAALDDPPLFVSSRCSGSPAVVKGRLYYLARDGGVRRVYSTSPADWLEAPLTPPDADVAAFDVLSSGDAFLLLADEPARSGSPFALHAPAIPPSFPRGGTERVRLDSPASLGLRPFLGSLAYYDVAVGLHKLAEGVSCPPLPVLSACRDGSMVCVETTGGPAVFDVRIRNNGEFKAKVKRLKAAFPSPPAGMAPLENGFLWASPEAVWRLDKRGDSERGTSAWPFSIGRVLSAAPDGSVLVSLAAGTNPHRLLGRLSEETCEVLPLSAAQAAEARRFLWSKGLFGGKPAVVAAEGELPLLGEESAPKFDLPPGRMPTAERAVAQGRVEDALALYLEKGDEYSLRAAELLLFHLGRRKEALDRFARVSEPLERRRVDLYLDLLTERSKKLAASYRKAFVSLDRGDIRGMLERGAYYFKKFDARTFDPRLFAPAVEWLAWHGREKEAAALVERAGKRAGEGRFRDDFLRMRARFRLLAGDEEGFAEDMAALEREDAERAPQYLRSIIRRSLERGSSLAAAREAFGRLLSFKLPFRDALELRVKSMLSAALLEGDAKTTEVEANYLAWGAYESPPFAAEAGALAVICCDVFSLPDGTAVLRRFCANPRVMVHAAVPVICRFAFDSAVMRLPREVFEKGWEALPDWFRARCRVMLSFSDAEKAAPLHCLRRMAGMDFDEARFERELAFSPLAPSAGSAEKPPFEAELGSDWAELAGRIRDLAAVLEAASGNAKGSAPVEAAFPYFGGPGVVKSLFSLDALPPGRRADRLMLLARRGHDPRLEFEARSFVFPQGEAVCSKLARLFPDEPPGDDEWSRALSTASADALASLLSARGADESSAPFWAPACALFVARGEAERLLPAAEAAWEKGGPLAKAAACNATCWFCEALGDTEGLMRWVARLDEVNPAGERILLDPFRATAAYSLARFRLAARKDDREGALRELERWFRRGGPLDVSRDALEEILGEYGEAFERWAASSPCEAAALISVCDKPLADYLLEKCGKAREAVEREIANLSAAGAAEEPAGDGKGKKAE